MWTRISNWCVNKAPLSSDTLKEVVVVPIGKNLFTKLRIAVVEHMFRDCPLLAEERDDAIHVHVGRLNLSDLLTKYGNLASQFAIRNFGIELFRYAQGYMVEVEGEKAPKKKEKKGSSTRRQRRAKVRAREE